MTEREADKHDQGATPRTDALMRFGHKNGPLVTPKEYIERSIMRSESGCWLWQRAKQGRGYGVLQVGTKTMQAHRFAYQELVEPIPAGLFVLHRCDQPLCVNPQHLYLGTDKENLADQYARNRRPRKLAAEKVSQVLYLRAQGQSQDAVASALGVSRQAVSYWEKRHEQC